MLKKNTFLIKILNFYKKSLYKYEKHSYNTLGLNYRGV